MPYQIPSVLRPSEYITEPTTISGGMEGRAGDGGHLSIPPRRRGGHRDDESGESGKFATGAKGAKYNKSSLVPPPLREDCPKVDPRKVDLLRWTKTLLFYDEPRMRCTLYRKILTCSF